MIRVHKIVRAGATFEDLIQFVEECKEKNMPLSTPVKISQDTAETLNYIVDIQADEDSIIFYDWI